jgi:hypothetical protein
MKWRLRTLDEEMGPTTWSDLNFKQQKTKRNFQFKIDEYSIWKPKH